MSLYYYAPQNFSQRIFINSKDSTQINTSKSSCTFDIPELLNKNNTDLDKVFQQTISISEVKIPNSFYAITNNCNKIDMIIYGSPTTYQVPPGNWNAYDFQNYWGTLNNGITLTYNYISNKFVFTSSSFDFSILKTSTMIKNLGFSDVNDQVSIGGVLESKFPVNFSKIGSMYLNIGPIDNRNSKTSNINCYERISLDTLIGGYYFWKSETKYDLGGIQPNVLQVEFRDEDDNLIDFQNQDWEIVLEVEINGVSVLPIESNLNFFYGG